MAEHPALINSEVAADLIFRIEDQNSRDAVRLLLEGVTRFFSEQPSQLQSPFDLAFFVEIVKEQLDNLRGSLDGTHEAKGWWEDTDFSTTYPVPNANEDVSESGIRERQAGNYVATRGDQRIQAALLCLRTWAFAKQNPKAKHVTGEPITTMRPAQPFDHLFMVMAVDYALRTGQPARLHLERKSTFGLR